MMCLHSTAHSSSPTVEKQTGVPAWKQNIVLLWTGAAEKHKKISVSAENFHQMGTEAVVSYFYLQSQHTPFTKKAILFLRRRK